jgi:ribosome biogenesis GTPase
MAATRPSRTTRHQSDNSNPQVTHSGLVLVNYGKALLVEDRAGALLHCSARRNLARIVCGDRVLWRPTGTGEGVIEAIEPRRSVLNRGNGERPLAANIDCIVVVAATQPAADEFLIDKYLVAAELAGITPLVVINKSDLLDAADRPSIDRCLGQYARIGYTTLLTSALRNTGIDLLRECLAGTTAVLVGQSGVGKSSLVKRLLPELEIAIGRLSAASGQGRHTTTATTLYHLPDGGDLIDSPGVRDFRPGPLSAGELAGGFREFQRWIGQCRFHNCRHLGEPGCALAAAAREKSISAQRLASYRRLAAAS